MRLKTLSMFTLASLICLGAHAGEVIRHKLPGNSTFPIALAVEIPATATVVNLSGAVPSAVDANAPKDSLQAYGNTQAQSESVFKSIETSLKSLDLSMSDVIKMQVFLVGDPAQGGKMDFGGFMKAYTQHFGTTAQPNLPTRSVVQVAGLANPGFLVEIEVTAVRR